MSGYPSGLPQQQQQQQQPPQQYHQQQQAPQQPGGAPPPQYAPPGQQGYGHGPPPQGYPQQYGQPGMQQPMQQGYPPQQGAPQQPYPQQPYPQQQQPQGMYPGQPGMGAPMQPQGHPQPGHPQATPMPMPTTQIPDCPPGLEYLSAVDQLLCHQQVELLEVFTGMECANKYEIKNTLGQQVYFAAESSNFCSRQCLGNLRPLDMRILDHQQRAVLNVNRPYRCSTPFCPFILPINFCCLQEMEVTDLNGAVIGSIKQNWSLCLPDFSLCDENGTAFAKIDGPLCTCAWCGDLNFNVIENGTPVGKVQKQFSGMAKELFTDADNFSISFPMQWSVKKKAVCLAAVFMIDFCYFEDSGNNNNNGAYRGY